MLKNQGRHEFVFLLVGDGAVREALAEEAEKLGLDNVVFTGRQDKGIMPAFLSVTDACLVHLKKTDLFTSVIPSKIFEAGGMARPIIMGVEGNAAEIVSEAGMGVFMEPEQESALVDALTTLSGDPELAQKMGQSGHDYIVKHFDRSILSEHYLAILQQVLDSMKGKR